MSTIFVNDSITKNVNAESARKREVQLATIKVKDKNKQQKQTKIQPRRWDDHGICD